MSERTALYRLFDSDDSLLYVGISKNPDQRIGTHKAERPWWALIARSTVEWYDSHIEAARAEAVAVREEAPSMNRALPAEDGSPRYALREPRPSDPAPAREFRRIRLNDDLWERLGEAAKRADPELDRSKLLRKFTRWYIGDTDDVPERPSRPTES